MSTEVHSIRILPALTGGYNADGQPGDEGITVGLQPVDAQGRVVLAAAPISIVLIDPGISDDSGRVARWDFAAEQIAALSENLPDGEALRITLLWPTFPPRHNRLHLFVRYITADGRKLQADIPLWVDVEGRTITVPSGTVSPTGNGSHSMDGSVGGVPGCFSSAAPVSMGTGAFSQSRSLGERSAPEGFFEEQSSSSRMETSGLRFSVTAHAPGVAQKGRKSRIPWHPNRTMRADLAPFADGTSPGGR
ncbi:MAG: hypothetical protein NZ602_07720 [Thermoguttaceae bacterium]|nr:hypothetical protein [Thermoguttaceae bacterium]MDW8036924.1 hypothetical protein [Thermoguttaceae bacterium]